MQLICNDQQLITLFFGKNSLLDGKIEKIEIFDVKSSVSINVNFYMRASSDYQQVQFRFSKCKEYSFSYSEDYFFYNVELVKLFQSDDGLFYVSFDPCDEVEVISSEDQDFILCREISAYCNKEALLKTE